MKLPYRFEIDGLRTIAVLSVILYHAQIVVFGHDFFKGGFVGVDIFFVISGYLISHILLSELFEKGKISFLEFYERRARRILPILFTVFIVSFPLAYKYLLPNQFIEYAQSILSATFFGSNIFFYFTNTQYGAEDSLLQPFLHTWSLGVEEQFYILFPIVLLLAYKFAKNHLVTIITVLILISLTYANWQSTKNTQLNFFILTSRLWELGIGSLLAFYELKYGRVKHELLNQTMPLLGLAMIAHAIVFFNNQTPHPSFITLLPTLGTALIILYSAKQTDLVGKVLSWKPIVGIGLISYSMYLWHYPLFAFARIGDANGLHNNEKIWLILLTILLSIVSYFVIEKPFRSKQFISTKKIVLTLSSFLTLIALLCISIFVTDGLAITELPKNPKTSYEYIDEEQWKKVKKNTLLIGDSHAKSLEFGLNLVTNGRIVSRTGAGCIPFRDITRWDARFEKYKCSNYINNAINEVLNNEEIINIIMTSMGPVYLENSPFYTSDESTIKGQGVLDLANPKENDRYLIYENGLTRTIKELLKKEKNIIYVIDVPEMKFFPKECLIEGNYRYRPFGPLVTNLSKINTEKCEYPLHEFKTRTKKYHETIKKVSKKFPTVVFFNPSHIFCNTRVCSNNDKENFLYKDKDHLSKNGSVLIAEEIKKILDDFR